jgi:hypothetical protein
MSDDVSFRIRRIITLGTLIVPDFLVDNFVVLSYTRCRGKAAVRTILVSDLFVYCFVVIGW